MRDSKPSCLVSGKLISVPKGNRIARQQRERRACRQCCRSRTRKFTCLVTVTCRYLPSIGDVTRKRHFYALDFGLPRLNEGTIGLGKSTISSIVRFPTDPECRKTRHWPSRGCALSALKMKPVGKKSSGSRTRRSRCHSSDCYRGRIRRIPRYRSRHRTPRCAGLIRYYFRLFHCSRV